MPEMLTEAERALAERNDPAKLRYNHRSSIAAGITRAYEETASYLSGI